MEEEYFSNHVSDRNSNDESSGGEDKIDNDNEKKDEEDKPKKIKFVVRKPQPKLDPSRLCGQRGLKCLLESFQNFKSKGDGNEFQDLDRMVNKYEYWAHRLFPKLKFNEVVEKLEKLGEKREVKSMMHRIRLNEEETNDVVPEQTQDPLLENQLMTERVLDQIGTQNNTADEEDEDEILKNLLNI